MLQNEVRTVGHIRHHDLECDIALTCCILGLSLPKLPKRGQMGQETREVRG